MAILSETTLTVNGKTVKVRAVTPDTYNPNPSNTNRGTERGNAAVDASLETTGFHRGIFTAADGTIVGGNHAWQSAVAKGVIGACIEIETEGDVGVVTKRIDWESAKDPQAILAAIQDNRTSELNYDPDPEMFAEAMRVLGEFEIDIPDVLFTDGEIGDILGDIELALDVPTEEDEETVADLIESAESGKIESRVKAGEIWALGRHRIACGDSTDEANVRRLLGNLFGNVGMVWADAPYGINVVSKDGSLGGNTKGKYSQILGDETKDVAYASFALCQKLFTANQFFWGANHFASAVTDSSCWIVWDKQDGKSVTFADCELAWTNIKQPARIFKHIWDGFRRDSERGEMRSHPTQKPIALCEWCFDKYGSPSDLIFDPFLGSAPSIIAAQKMEGNRTVYGFELSPDYCEVICRRYEEFTGETAVLVGHL